MVKRISCRVVRSVTLDKAGGTLHSATCPDNNPHETDDIISPDTKSKYKSNSVGYTSRSNIAAVSVDNGLTGQFVDCYI
ncbi:MAG: hypothetical protein ACYS9Y_15265 [Planctomycetota bacterium]|jgi:hypothetical protein